MNPLLPLRKFPISIFLLCSLCSMLSFAQTTGNWEYLQNSPPTPDRFDDIYFVTDSLGWAVNSQGKIYRTDDAGNNWALQLSKSVYFRSVEFLNKDTGFAGTLNGKFYKTVDGGFNWYNIIDSLPLAVDGICGMSHIGNTIYACGVWSSPAYVLKSSDAGNTWTMTDMSAYADALVDCYFLSKDTGFVSGSDASSAGHGIILKTEDGGASWQIKENTDIGNYVWKMDFVTSQLAYASIENFSAGDSSAILKSTDGGNNWSKMNVTPIYMNMEGVGFLNDTLGWCGGWSDGMWQTEDGGLTWNFLNIGLNFNRYFRINPNLMYAAGKGIYVFQQEGFATQIPYVAAGSSLPHELLPSTPNPFSGKVNIRFELSNETRVRLEIFNVSGIRVIDEKPGYLSKGFHSYTFDFSNLSQGEYLVVLKTNERTLLGKIICLNAFDR